MQKSGITSAFEVITSSNQKEVRSEAFTTIAPGFTQDANGLILPRIYSQRMPDEQFSNRNLKLNRPGMSL